MERERRTTGLMLVAAFKLLKAVLLVVVGLAALKLAHGEWLDALLRVAHHFNLAPGRRLFGSLVEHVLRAPSGRLEALGLGTFLYAALFLVEGVGLWLARRWAEYLTVVSTGGFIPLEVVELVHAPSPLKWAGLLLNVAVVVYLVLRLRHERHAARLVPA